MKALFNSRLVGDDIWAIDGPVNELMHLIIGEKKALLVDTGMGFGNLESEVRRLTYLPLIVVNTHGHPDHAGGNANFPRIYFPEQDRAIMAAMCTPQYRLDDLRAFYGEHAPEYQNIAPSILPEKSFETLPLTAGHVFDLGGRRLEVIALAGHTPGCMALLNTDERILFSGDSIVRTPVWLYLKHSLPFRIYLESMEKLASRQAEFDTIYPGHNPTGLHKEIFFQLLECARHIAANWGIGEWTRTFAGEGMLWKQSDVSIIYDPNNQ
jgi:glyoxylase-like metal-dependent hydrolase (beta-lactamase superfamily II)